MINLLQHLLLSKIAKESTAQDMACIGLVVRSYEPGADEESQLDWLQVCRELGTTLSFLSEPPEVAADDPNFLRKPARQSDPKDFPEIRANV